MKRVLVFFLVISIFCISLVPNVSASSDLVDESFLNYWDFSNSESSFILNSSNDYTVTFDLPRELYIRYVDILINTGVEINSVTVVSGDISNEMTMLELNNGFYRFYSHISGGSSAYSEDIKFIFDITGSSASVSFHNFTFSLNRYYFNKDIPVSYIVADTFAGNSQGTISSYPYTYRFDASQAPYPLADPYNYNFGLFLSEDEWRKYDELRISLYSKMFSLNTFTVTIDDLNIPFDVSVFNSLTGYECLLNTTTYGYFFDETDGLYTLDITIDLTGINKSDLSGSLYFRVLGSRDINVSSFITVQNVFGYVSTDNLSPLSFWFSNLIDNLGNYFGNLTSDIESFFDNLTSNLLTQFKSLRTTLTDSFYNLSIDLGNWFSDLSADIGNWFRDLTADIESFFDNLTSNLLTQFKSLRTTLTNLLTASDSQQAAADDFQDSVNSQSTELDSLTADLNSAEKPPISDIEFSVGNLLDQSSVTLATNGISSILNNEIILRVLLISLTLALSGFILFGKR